jgi:membrane-bound lytic murein transglycosylase D
VDERLDPERSTRAAALYLKELYGIFQNWELAIAGFNAGERTISELLARRRASSFWELCQYPGLMRTTRDFVPKFAAAMKMARDPEHYGFSGILYEEPWRFERVKVSQELTIETIARLAGTDPRKVQALNPQLKRRASPPGPWEVELRLPEGTAETFTVELAQRPPGVKDSLWAHSSGTQPARVIVHRVRSKETLTEIARRYRTQVDAIQEFNSIIPGERLRAGSMLRISLPAEDEGSDVLATERRPARSRGALAARGAGKDLKKPRAIVHRVKKGENLWSISKRYGVEVDDLCKWNGLKGHHIAPGDQLSILQ